MGRQGSLRLQSDPSQGPNTSVASTGVTQTHYLDEIALEAPQSYSRPPPSHRCCFGGVPRVLLSLPGAFPEVQQG